MTSPSAAASDQVSGVGPKLRIFSCLTLVPPGTAGPSIVASGMRSTIGGLTAVPEKGTTIGEFGSLLVSVSSPERSPVQWGRYVTVTAWVPKGSRENAVGSAETSLLDDTMFATVNTSVPAFVTISVIVFG